MSDKMLCNLQHIFDQFNNEGHNNILSDASIKLIWNSDAGHFVTL